MVIHRSGAELRWIRIEIRWKEMNERRQRRFSLQMEPFDEVHRAADLVKHYASTTVFAEPVVVETIGLALLLQRIDVEEEWVEKSV